MQIYKVAFADTERERSKLTLIFLEFFRGFAFALMLLFSCHFWLLGTNSYQTEKLATV